MPNYLAGWIRNLRSFLGSFLASTDPATRLASATALSECARLGGPIMAEKLIKLLQTQLSSDSGAPKKDIPLSAWSGAMMALVSIQRVAVECGSDVTHLLHESILFNAVTESKEPVSSTNMARQTPSCPRLAVFMQVRTWALHCWSVWLDNASMSFLV